MPHPNIQTPQAVPNRWLDIILVLFSMLAAAWFWWSARLLLIAPFDSLAGQYDFSPNFILTFLASYATLLASLILLVIFVHDLRLRLVAYAVIVIGPLLILDDLLALGLIALFLALAIGMFDHFSRYDLTIHTKADLLHIFPPRFTWMTTAIAFSVALCLFLVGYGRIKELQLIVPEQFLEQGYQIAKPFISEQIQVQQDNVYEIAMQQIENQIPALQNIPIEDKRSLIQGKVTENVRQTLRAQGLSDQQINSLAEQIQSSLQEGNELLTYDPNQAADLFFGEMKTEIQQNINNFVEDNKDILPWTFSIATFLSITSLAFLFHTVSILICYLLLFILHKTKIIEKELISIPAERLIPTSKK